MGWTIPLDHIESDAYRERFDDGLVDVFVGLSLLWIGVCWLWIPDLAAFAGVFPAVMVAPFVMGRKDFLERRAGYVRFGAERRRWERRNLVMALLVGAVVLLVAVGTFLAVGDGSSVGDVIDASAPAIIAVLLSAAVIVVGMVSGLRRFLVYGGVLFLAGGAAALLDANPGLPILVGGILPTLFGCVLLVRFARTHPSPTRPAPTHPAGRGEG